MDHPNSSNSSITRSTTDSCVYTTFKSNQIKSNQIKSNQTPETPMQLSSNKTLSIAHSNPFHYSLAASSHKARSALPQFSSASIPFAPMFSSPSHSLV